jgi:hypothetical protein
VGMALFVLSDAYRRFVERKHKERQHA